MYIFSECLGISVLHILASVSGLGRKFPQDCEFPHEPQTNDPPFMITSTHPDGVLKENVHELKVTLQSSSSRCFRGFMLESRDMETNRPVGTFTVLDDTSTRLLDCYGVPGSAVTHKNNSLKSVIQVNWTGGPGMGPNIDFRAAFLDDVDVFWETSIGITTQTLHAIKQGTTPPNTSPTTQQTSSYSQSTHTPTSNASKQTANLMSSDEPIQVVPTNGTGAPNTTASLIRLKEGTGLMIASIPFYTIIWTSTRFQKGCREWWCCVLCVIRTLVKNLTGDEDAEDEDAEDEDAEDEDSCSMPLILIPLVFCEFAALVLFFLMESRNVMLIVLPFLTVFFSVTILPLSICSSKIHDAVIPVMSFLHEIFSVDAIFVGLWDIGKLQDTPAVEVMSGYTAWRILFYGCFVVWNLVKGWDKEQKEGKLAAATLIFYLVSIAFAIIGVIVIVL